MKQAQADFDSLFRDSTAEAEKNYLEKLFHILRLLQQRFSSYQLLSKGYNQEMIECCIKIRNYLWTCYQNQTRESKRGFK